MSRGAVVLPALVLLAAGIAAVVFAAASSADVARAVVPTEPHLARAYPRAAAAAYGRRVLVLHAGRREGVAGEILESARAGGGWELHPAAPAGAQTFATALAELAVRAARDWGGETRLRAPTVERLARAGVAIVVVEDGRDVIVPQSAAQTPGLVPEPSVPSLRVRGAEPVLRRSTEYLLGGEGLRLDPARVRDLRDGLWGGSVVVEVDEPGATFVFTWPREGARVTVDGSEVVPERWDPLDFVALQLAAGDRAVDVTYAAAGGRAPWAIGGALAIVVALLALLLALRPQPAREPAADGPRPAPEGAA